MRWQQHWACRHQYGISQEQMPSKCPDREARTIKVMRLEDSRSLRRMRMTRQLVGDDQRAEMRGGKKDATANIVTGVATAAEAAAGKGIGSIAGEIETTRASHPHGVAIGATGAGAVAGMRTIADDTGTTGPSEAEVAAGNIEGPREMDSIGDLLMVGGVSVLNADEMIDRFRNHARFKQANRTTFWGHDSHGMTGSKTATFVGSHSLRKGKDFVWKAVREHFTIPTHSTNMGRVASGRIGETALGDSESIWQLSFQCT